MGCRGVGPGARFALHPRATSQRIEYRRRSRRGPERQSLGRFSARPAGLMLLARYSARPAGLMLLARYSARPAGLMLLARYSARPAGRARGLRADYSGRPPAMAIVLGVPAIGTSSSTLRRARLQTDQDQLVERRIFAAG